MSCEATPIIMYCTRTIKAGNMDAYKAAWTAYSTDMNTRVAGIKAIVSFVDKDKPGQVIQYFHYSCAGDCHIEPPRPLAANLRATYDDSKGVDDVCQVWGGGYGEKLKTVLSSRPDGLRYVLKPLSAGFIRPTGMGLAGPPIVFISRRKVQAGRMPAYEKAMQDVCDHWYAHCPGLLGGCAYISEEDPLSSWDLRLMANWEDGYLGHKLPERGGNPALGKAWFTNAASPPVPFSGMPSAVAFSNYGEELVGPNGSAGNKQYRHYRWSERIPGPLPDLNKGDPSFSRTELRHHLIAAGVLAAAAIGWLAYKRATSSD